MDENPKTHGPQIQVTGNCRPCEFLSRPLQNGFHYCYYVEGAPLIPDRALRTPAWCPLLRPAAENFLAEQPTPASVSAQPMQGEPA